MLDLILLGFFLTQKKGNQYTIVLVDFFIKWVEIESLSSFYYLSG